MKVLIQHESRYEYDRLVYLTPHYIRLKPAPHCHTPIKYSSLIIKPENHFFHAHQDAFGNFLTRIDFKAPTRLLSIKVDIAADIIPFNPFDFFIDETAQYFPFEYEPLVKKGIVPYLEITEKGVALTNWINTTDLSRRETVSFLLELNQRIYRDIAYTVRMEPGVQSCEISLSKASGSCRDTAWLLVQVLRHLGLAARFVSGYLTQLKDQNTANGEIHKDLVALHAWAEVYIPGAGWIGLDPTSGQFAGEGYIPLACTPDPDSAAPITGTSEISKTDFTYTSTITRICNSGSL